MHSFIVAITLIRRRDISICFSSDWGYIVGQVLVRILLAPFAMVLVVCIKAWDFIFHRGATRAVLPVTGGARVMNHANHMQHACTSSDMGSVTVPHGIFSRVEHVSF